MSDNGTEPAALVAQAAAAPVQQPQALKGRVPELDGIRGLAILLVVLWHYVPCKIQAEPGSWMALVNQCLGLTWSGVDLFFVLSGYLIGGILLDARQSPSFFKTFYIRRICRIFPLYFVLVSLNFALLAPAGNSSDSAFKPLFDTNAPFAFYALFIQNYWMAAHVSYGSIFLSVTWSLAIEEQFYLTLPLMIRILSRHLLAIVVAVLVLGALALRYYFAVTPPPENVVCAYLWMPARLDALGLGVLAAILHRNARAWEVVFRYRWVLLALLVPLIAGNLYMIQLKLKVTTRLMAAFGYSWLALTYSVLLVLALAWKEGWIAKFFRVGILREMGTVAYGIYLLHGPIQWCCFMSDAKVPLSGWVVLKLGGAALLTFAAAEASWRLFEKPIVRIGQRYSY